MKQKIIAAIDRNRESILAIGQQILRNPEMGFKEFKTAQLVKDTFSQLGIAYEDGLAVTGVKGTVGKKPGMHICIIGEMDAVKCYDHPNADPQTGAAHACGHNVQVAAMLGASVHAIEDACGKVDNAVKAGAMAVGATCDVRDTGGYAPLHQNEVLSKAFEENAQLFMNQESIRRGVDMTGSTDMGDLSRIMPVIQPTMGGYSGALHSKEFAVTDPETAFITAAKLLACTAYDLLENGGERAKLVKETFAK